MSLKTKTVQHYFFLAFMSALLLTTASCEKVIGEGPVVTENRNTVAFEGLAVSIEGDVYFTKSDEHTIQLQAQQNILDEIETVVSDNILKVRFRHRNVNIRNHERIQVHITGPDARLLELNGSGKLDVSGAFDPAEAKLVISGSGHINAEALQSNSIEAIMSGSGRIKVQSGQANREKITISGSGFVDLSEITVKEVEAQISGSGTTEVHATHTLKAKISGSGTVYYKGSPAITSTISGSGSVVKL